MTKVVRDILEDIDSSFDVLSNALVRHPDRRVRRALLEVSENLTWLEEELDAQAKTKNRSRRS